MNDFDYPELFVIIVNAFLPIVIQFVKTKITSYEGRYAVAFVFSGLTAVIGIVWSGQWNMGNILAMFALAVAAGQTAYQLFWHQLLKSA